MRPSFIRLLALLLLTACASTPSTPASTPSAENIALLYAAETASGLRLLREDASGTTTLPYEPPTGCLLWSLKGAPDGRRVALEWLCGGTSLVQVVDGETGALLWPGLPETDTRLLAWNADGSGLYLRADSLGDARILLIRLDGGDPQRLPLPATVYDLAVAPDGGLLYSLTRGLGFGSQTFRAAADGRRQRAWDSDPLAVRTFLAWSPDGTQVAYIRMPDTQLPFPEGELWVADADGTNARRLAAADAGHGFAPVWSPDGNFLAYVERLNADDPRVGYEAGALRSAVRVLELATGATFRVTPWEEAQAMTPAWSPDGSRLACPVMRDGKMSVWVYDLHSGELRPAGEAPACCPVWMWK